MPHLTSDPGISLDGFIAGRDQSLEDPLGVGGENLHRWMFEEPERHAAEREAITAASAYIMGRNMFASGRGDWDLDWKGWWGDDPPYHGPVFVLTHYEREPVEMEGGTTFHFVTDGIEAAMERAKEAAGDRTVSIAGGASTVQQYLRAGLIDELRLHIAPVILGSGERLLEGVGDLKLEQLAVTSSELVTHITLRVG